MLLKSTEFFKNLPPKQCRECGKKIDEQHECYMSHCEDCIKIGEY